MYSTYMVLSCVVKSRNRMATRTIERDCHALGVPHAVPDIMSAPQVGDYESHGLESSPRSVMKTAGPGCLRPEPQPNGQVYKHPAERG
jgi:hypothetical protein